VHSQKNALLESYKNQFNPKVKAIQSKSLQIVEEELHRNSALLSELKLSRWKLKVCFRVLNTSRREQLPRETKGTAMLSKTAAWNVKQQQ